MADFFEDFKGATTFSISWINEGKAWLYLGLMLALFFATWIGSFLSMLLSAISPLLYLLSFFPLILIANIVSFYLSAKLMLLALEKRGLPFATSLNIGELFNLLLLAILSAIYAVFSLMEIRFLLILLAVVISAVLGFAVNPIFFILTFFLYIGYMAIVMYNSARLSFSFSIFLSKGGSKTQSINDSWAITQGNVLKVMGLFFLYGILVGLATLLSFGLLALPATVSLVFFNVAVYSNLLKEWESALKKTSE